MTRSKVLLPAAVALTMALTGCTTKTVSQSQYSGFLSSYEGLEKVKSPSGATVQRWVAPGFDVSQYDSVVVQPLSYYPQPKPTDRIDQTTLDALLSQANQQVGGAIAQRLPVVSAQAAGPRTLLFRGAITGVAAETQGLRPYEILPIALVLAGAVTAAGERDQNTELYLEGELVEFRSGKPVMRLVRKGFGKTLSDDQQKITTADMRPVIDQLTRDAIQFNPHAAQ
ncbi:Protein of unknown function [Aquipseudomonas alcaligenes]|uniref:DUF3313 domain-containing protein n=1 Tax=Aquipseudomonas alcaligenes TaxID=43263 RepID=UPI00095668EC|nr:DUF3313 domain-containing protein [Pseudomonas alcaligenes]SIR93251.1 Protein of unknown function [Pseudomonas alcaligenes]